MPLSRVARLSVAAALLVTLSVPAQAFDRHITLFNETSVAIVEFHGARVGTDDWGENLLGEQTLPGGSSVTVDLADRSFGYCLFNFRAVFADGDEIVSKRINVCDEDAFYYRP